MSLYDHVEAADRRLAVPLMGSVGARLAGHKLGDCLRESGLHLKCLGALVETFDPDALFPIMDLTLEAEALGLAIAFPEDEAPSVAEHPVASSEALSRLELPDPSSSGRMPVFLSVLEGMRGLTASPLGSYVIGPFTLAAELSGAEELAVRTISDGPFAEAVIDFASEAICIYAEQLARRADIVAILEPSAVMLSPASFEGFVRGPLERLTHVIKSNGAFPVLHICGNSTHLLQQMSACGAEGFSIDSPVDMRVAAASVGSHQVVMGNIDPVAVMLEGDARKVKAACADLLEKMEGIPNFALASGCDLPADTPKENIASLVAAVK